MRTPDLLARIAFAGAAALMLAGHAAAQSRYGIGHAATPAQVASWDIDIAPDGRNLPAVRGTVAHGRDVYAAQCASCHGARGEGGLGDKLTGGNGTLATPAPVKTVGSYWPYATTLFDYIRRAMPLNAPQSLSNEDVYAVSGYVLYLNGLVDENATIDAKALIALKMPNRDGFIADPRPDVKDAGCLRDCTK
jgi:cytochrome c